MFLSSLSVNARAITRTLISDICRTYEFDLSRSYERACVLELLDTVAANPAVEFGAFEYCAASRDGPFTALRIAKRVQERTIAPGSRQHRERQALESIRTISSVPIRQFRAAVQVCTEYMAFLETSS